MSLHHLLPLLLSTLTLTHASPTPTFPNEHWETRTPEQVHLQTSTLKQLPDYTGGAGCIVRHGYLVFTWGDFTRPRDIASAAKPLYTHFLLLALQNQKIPSLDQPIADVIPELASLNPSLNHKDQHITWRHLCNQTSCYGSLENPGTAFDYNDHNMALLFDALMLHVYKSSWQNIDADILHPLLTTPLQCEDNPSFMAFGTDNRPGRAALSPRDFARFGLLYLHHGQWKNQQLLPPELTRLATQSPIPLTIPRTQGQPAQMLPNQRSIGGGGNQCDHEGSYSYAWWINGTRRDGSRNWPNAPHDTFACLGHGDMRAVIVIPSLNIVVSWNDTRIQGHEMINHALHIVTQAITP
jgi:CubicO group peptidase (beta-lactamase class C family)